jgi:flagellar hook-length control protein FliK
VQSCQISTDSSRSATSLLNALAQQPRLDRDNTQSTSDFQRHLDDLRSNARPSSSSKSTSSRKADKAGSSRDSQKDSDSPQATDAAASSQSNSDQTNSPDGTQNNGDVIVVAADALAPDILNSAIDSAAQAADAQAEAGQALISTGHLSPKPPDTAGQHPVVSHGGSDPSQPGAQRIHPTKSAALDHRTPEIKPLPSMPLIDESSEPVPVPVITANGKIQDAQAAGESDEPAAPHLPLSDRSSRSTQTSANAKPSESAPAIAQSAMQTQSDSMHASRMHERIASDDRNANTNNVKLFENDDAGTNAPASSSQRSTNAPTSANRQTGSKPSNSPIRVANASGDVTASTIGRWLLSSKTDSQDEGTSTSQSQLAVATSAEKPSPTASSPATSGVSSTSAHASPVAARVAELITTDRTALDNIDSVARSLSSANGNGRHQVTLQLDPPELGRLRLDIRMEEGAMTLRVDAQAASAAKLIESRIPELRDALAVHGIRIDRTEIVVRSPESGQSGPQQEHSQQGAQHGPGQHSTNSDAGQRGWFSDADGNRGHDNPRWGGGASDIPSIAAAAASAANEPAFDSNLTPRSLNLVA